MEHVATFVARARAFAAFIEGAADRPLVERLSVAREQLAHLYAAASLLPVVECFEDTPEPERPRSPASWTPFASFEAYWEVFDPYVIESPVAGSLSDDLLDVFADVVHGLRYWDRGDEAAAIWNWRFSFETHWGDHAVDALRALHRACARSNG